MPSDHCFGFDDHERRSSATPQLREPHPEESVGDTETEFVRTGRALKDQELMPEGKDLCLELGPSPKALPNQKKERENGREHGIDKLYR